MRSSAGCMAIDKTCQFLLLSRDFVIHFHSHHHTLRSFPPIARSYILYVLEDCAITLHESATVSAALRPILGSRTDDHNLPEKEQTEMNQTNNAKQTSYVGMWVT